MKLFIKIKDGQPFEHPIIESNFRQAFPNIDVDNLPSEFARFVRVQKPEPDEGKHIVRAECRYEWAGDEVTDVWYVEQEDIIDSPEVEPTNIE